MPVRFSSPAPKPVKEFVEPIASDYFIWWLFQGKCIVCGEPACGILDTVPNSDWETRMSLCEKHFYSNKDLWDLLREKRDEFLLNNGREKYVNFIPAEVQVFSVGKFIESELAKDINTIMPDGLDFIMVNSV